MKSQECIFLALAIRLEPETMRRVRRVVAMGTGGLGRGNVTPVAEFNIWQDAEAAKIIVEFGFSELMFVGWDACLGESMLTAADIERIRSSGRLGAFAMDCNAQLLALNRERFGEDCLDMADPAAVAAALCPECIGNCSRYFCEVDISPGPGYGGFYVDVDGCLGRQPNAFVCSSLKADVYKEYVFQRLSEGAAKEMSGAAVVSGTIKRLGS
ncbi:nucleoside hydrolase [Lachnoclostridium sp. Marseille-P6806]|uniref:nucleoside hydrolase n=1 Tax=Lachnoclostridium sp. Marseille-P6806 TaxID=2364793 RepID=UPI001F5EF57D|nr:nucleoside hydrolase [Lachnoclostridium sp. Marseille-P6806]